MKPNLSPEVYRRILELMTKKSHPDNRLEKFEIDGKLLDSFKESCKDYGESRSHVLRKLVEEWVCQWLEKKRLTRDRKPV